MKHHEHQQLPLLLSCRILYSTQSGRAKACARRTGRIINDMNHDVQQQQQHIRLQNGQGCTFDGALIEASTPTILEYVDHMKQSGTNLLLCFVSTTGDGEHTVGRLCRVIDFVLLSNSKRSADDEIIPVWLEIVLGYDSTILEAIVSMIIMIDFLHHVHQILIISYFLFVTWDLMI
jgi:hypothetical protein